MERFLRIAFRTFGCYNKLKVANTTIVLPIVVLPMIEVSSLESGVVITIWFIGSIFEKM
ncbi:MAG: hypothetical protein ACLU94_05270 [Catenibacillus sp.]